MLVAMNPYSFFMAQNTLIRNVVSVPVVMFLLIGLDQIDRKQLGRGIAITVASLLVLFFTHNLSLVVGAAIVVVYTLLSRSINRQEKSLIIFIAFILTGVVLLFSMGALLPWMFANIWINWPRIFDSVFYVPAAVAMFNFLLILLFPPNNTTTRACSIVGIFLVIGSWIAPIGIEMRLVYYTPLLLQLCIHSNMVERRYVGVQLFSYLLGVMQFLLLIISTTMTR